MNAATKPARRMSLGKQILSLAGAALLAWMAWFAYSMVTGGERMTGVCAQVRPGMTVGELTRFAEEHGLGPRRLTAQTRLAYLAESRSFGRHACRVELERGVVIRATYNFAD